MAILREIQKWSQTLPAWQQDAIARLYAKSELSAEDYEDLYALLKAEHGIPDLADRVADKLAAGQVASPPGPETRVQLVAIKNLRNVNAIAEGKVLPICPTGLTVIYGENGAGKSGYSRVLKKACRARDQREMIHPDANKPGEVGPAEAGFDLLVDGLPLETNWTHGMEPPEILSAIAIFDSHCARAYVDNQGDFAYSPYGLDLLEKLVKLCDKLKARAVEEQQANTPNTEPFNVLSKTSTAVGKLLATLSAETKLEELEALASFSKPDQLRLSTLNSTLSVADPKQKAKVLRLRAARFTQLASRIGVALVLVDEESVTNLKKLVETSCVATCAAELASKKFKEKTDQLPGTGGDAWQKLFEAARTFALDSHPDKIFPDLGAESLCPLCQQVLGDSASKRLKAFDAFIQQEAEKNARDSKAQTIAAYRAVELADIQLGLDEALVEELSTSRLDLAVACSTLQKALIERRAAILKATGPEGDWEAIPCLPTGQLEALEEIARQLIAEAEVLEIVTDEKAKAEMVLEQAELDARRQLAGLKVTAVEVVSKFVLINKLKACVESTASGTISRKSTDISRTLATEELAKTLNAELTNLNVHELRVAMKPESSKGKTQFKLVLELPSGVSPKDILSEGEQRAIAIASFLAEVSMSKGCGGIVFDDPVSSLDHRRRWHVARRLAEEATRRQVIVLTHDIYFLCLIQHEADSLGIEIGLQCVRRTPEGFGVGTDRLPFDAMSTTKRVKALRQMQVEAAKAHKAGDQEGAKRITTDAYYHLRLAWERGIEEVLFQGAVTRFTEGVSTQKLSYVIVDDTDYATIEAGMAKSSKFAHDSAAAAQLSTPHPDELHVDIEALEAWRKTVDGRKDAIRARRL